MSRPLQVPQTGTVPFLRRFLRFFFKHFYHGFAWTYDFVATVVSIGRWNEWVACAVPYIAGDRILEIGHGPGHLQLDLRRGGFRTVFALDESPQMGRLAKRRLMENGYASLGLARARAQSIPFPGIYFDTVVSTFPAEYIFEPETMQEIRRVLTEGGRFVMLPAAWIIGTKAMDKAAAWLFRATNQAPRVPAEALAERLRGGLEEAGFSPAFEVVQIRSSEVLVIIAEPRRDLSDQGVALEAA